MLFKTKRRKLEEEIKNLKSENNRLSNNLINIQAELDAVNTYCITLDNNYEHMCEERDYYKRLMNTYKKQVDTARKKNRERQAKYRAKKKAGK